MGERQRDAKTGRFEIFEAAFRTSGAWDNPYVQVEAAAQLSRPDGSTWSIPLFYDGGDVWKLRVSPDLVGPWTFSLRSNDPGLDGKAGEFACVPSSQRGGLQPMDGFPYHFQYQDGTPVWLLGDTQWRAFAEDPGKGLHRESVCRYADRRSEQGFNYVHADVMGGGGIDSGQLVFHSFEDEVINPAFFQEVDARLRYFNERGIACGLVLAWHKGPVALDALPGKEAWLRYARYMVARYSAFSVVFIVGGEWDQIKPWRKSWFQAVGSEIARLDPHGRMRGIHPCMRRSVEEFAKEPWMSFGDYQQAYEAPHGREALPSERRALHFALLKARVHGKPVVNSEYAYYLREMDGNDDYRPGLTGVDKPHSHTRDSFRRASWVLAMAGGYFVTGFAGTYYGGRRHKGNFDPDDPRNAEAEADLLRLKEFFEKLPWWRLEPDSALVHADDGGYAYLLRERGVRYVVYCEETAGIRLDLDVGDEMVERVAVKQYDPRTGRWEAYVAGAKEGVVHLAAPDRADWAFVVEPA